MTIKYLEFIKEAYRHNMIIGHYVYFNSNIRNCETPTKGKYAKIIDIKKRRIYYKSKETYTIEFETPIIVKIKDENGKNINRVETDTLKITDNQIRTLDVIPPNFIELHKSGASLLYNSSPLFKDIMSDIKFKIKNRKYLDISYFDIDANKDDFVSYMPSGKMKMLDSKDDVYESKYRQSTKIGKIFRKLNGELTDSQIENYVHEFKAIWKIFNGEIGDKLQIVNGEKIPYWYYEVRYAEGKGPLNGSCMRYANTQDRVKFYAKYPDKISMIILLDDENKLLARALIWKLDEPKDTIFMDRIYFVKTCHGKILEKYAKENNMKTKSEGWNLRNKMIVEISRKAMDPIPFLDSFRWDLTNKRITNK